MKHGANVLNRTLSQERQCRRVVKSSKALESGQRESERPLSYNQGSGSESQGVAEV